MKGESISLSFVVTDKALLNSFCGKQDLCIIYIEFIKEEELSIIIFPKSKEKIMKCYQTKEKNNLKNNLFLEFHLTPMILFLIQNRNYLNIKNMQQSDFFNRFLTESYTKILQACLQDEAIQTLKILENKEYLLNRVNELFSQIYQEEKQNKIDLLERRIRELQEDKDLKEANFQERCLSCQAMQNQLFALEKEKKRLTKQLSEIAIFEEKESKKLDIMLISENDSMKKQIKQLEDELNLKRNAWQEETNNLTNEILKLKISLKTVQQQSEKLNVNLKQSFKQCEEEKQKLQKQVFQYLEQKGKEERDIREFNTKFTNLTLVKEKMQTQVNMYKNENTILVEKIERLEQQNDYLKSSIDNAQKQNKNLQKKHEQIVEQIVVSNSNQNSNYDKINQSFSPSFLNKYHEIQKINLELEKQNRDMKTQLQSKANEYHEASINQQKTIMKLNEDLKKMQLRCEREMRQHREQLKSLRENISGQCEESQEKEISILVKKYSAIISEKDKMCDRLSERSKELNNSLIKNQELMSILTFDYQEEKRVMNREIQKLKQMNKQLKKHHNNDKASGQLFEKEYAQKIQMISKEKQQLSRQLENKEKEIKNANKQMAKIVDDNNTKELMITALQRKYDQNLKQNQSLQIAIKSFKDSIKQQDRSLKEFSEKNEMLLEEKDSYEEQLNKTRKNVNFLQEKIKRLEKEATQRRQLIVSLQQGNKNEVLDLYQKTQIVAQQSKKQLQSYYITLLKNKEEKLILQEKRSLQKMKKEQISEIQEKNKDLEDKVRKFKVKYSDQQKQRQSLQQKILHLFDQIDTLKNENRDLIEQLHLEKKENVKIIRAYQEKMMEYYRHFGQFKKQLYLNMRQELQTLKMDLKNMVLIVETEIEKMKEYLTTFSYKILQEVETLQMKHETNLEKVRHEYEYGTILKLEEEKREAQVQFELKVKEQSMEFFTILAEKEHIISAMQSKQGKMMAKINDIQLKKEQIQKIARDSTKKQEQLKEIITKMNQKVNEAERSSTISKNEVEHLRKENLQLKKEMLNLETAFKEKIQKCRQNYSAQNERLFNRYEKQFSKFIASNKKSLEFSMLSQSKSSSNILIPTKGCQNDDKLEKIQRQIEEQKKKLNLLEQGVQEKTKMDKTFKIGTDHLKIQRMRKA